MNNDALSLHEANLALYASDNKYWRTISEDIIMQKIVFDITVKINKIYEKRGDFNFKTVKVSHITNLNV